MSSAVVFNSQTVDLDTDSAARAELWQLYRTKRRRSDRLPLACVKHGSPMYLQMRHRNLYACHYPHTDGGPECRVNIAEPEGPEHRHIKTYAVETLSPHFDVTAEHPSGNGTVLDVFVEAPFRFGIEAQWSRITRDTVQDRTLKSTAAGIPPFWTPRGDPTWGRWAPTLRYNPDDTDWQQMPPKGTVTALGVKHIVAVRCTARDSPANFKCPDQPRGFCGNWHPYYEPSTGWTLDRAWIAIGHGELALHQTALDHILVVSANTLPLYEQLTGLPGQFAPTAAPPPQPSPQQHRECIALRPVEWAYGDLCMRCHKQELWAPASITRGLCEQCWPDIAGQPFQLTFPFKEGPKKWLTGRRGYANHYGETKTSGHSPAPPNASTSNSYPKRTSTAPECSQ